MKCFKASGWLLLSSVILITQTYKLRFNVTAGNSEQPLNLYRRMSRPCATLRISNENLIPLGTARVLKEHDFGWWNVYLTFAWRLAGSSKVATCHQMQQKFDITDKLADQIQYIKAPPDI